MWPVFSWKLVGSCLVVLKSTTRYADVTELSVTVPTWWALEGSLCQITCIHAVLLVAHPAPQLWGTSSPWAFGWHCLGSLLASPCSHYHLWQSPQTVPGTEALCKEVSNEKEVLEVQGVGWVPSLSVHITGNVGLANPVSQGWELGGCGWRTPGRRRWEGLETDFPFFQWVIVWKNSVRWSTDLLFSLFQDISFVLTLEYISLLLMFVWVGVERAAVSAYLFSTHF